MIGRKGDGWLLANGWAFVEGDNARIALALEKSPAQFKLVTDFFSPGYLSRHDVNEVYSKAPSNCGFSLAIPTSQPISHQLQPALIFHHNNTLHICRLTAIEDASRPQDLYHKYDLAGTKRERLSNLLLNECERLSGVINKSSKPISLFLDPSFACNLHCPNCISESLRKQGFSRKLMRSDRVHEILDKYGAYLIRATLALWGEPLLNKRFAEIVRLLKAYDIFCETSTNLSVPLSDQSIEAIVSSGLDEVRLSIDGATQETYEHYRVGGNLNLVLNNLQRLVDVKRRLGVKHPKLRWQYLLFPWNQHERELAEHLAKEYGADEFYSFPGDLWNSTQSIKTRVSSDDVTPLGERGYEFSINMSRRVENFQHAGCDFLDHTLAIHSDGTIFPCCYFPTPKDALGSWEELEPDPFNAPPIIRLRSFVNNLRNGPVGYGPSPCSGCGSLTKGYVQDHLDFFKAYQRITSYA